ncbi:MAG: hypothetical protein EZS28_014098, partial [Streblomastix strix]
MTLPSYQMSIPVAVQELAPVPSEC